MNETSFPGSSALWAGRFIKMIDKSLISNNIIFLKKEAT
jgi:hypothetical protein